MTCVNFVLKVFLLSLKISVASAQTIKFHNVEELSDRTCSGSHALITVESVTSIRCALLCEKEDECSGFTFRPSDRRCVVCQGGDGDLVVTQTGMQYFGLINRNWGDSCSLDTECIGENQGCFDGVCVCEPGYSYQATTDTCHVECVVYGDTFQKYTGCRILGNNDEQIRGFGVDACLQKCISNPACRSFEYSYDLNGDTVCNIQTITALDLPANYNCISRFDYYNRNC